MQIVRTIDELQSKLDECAEALLGENGSDEAMRNVFSTFSMDFSDSLPADPFSRDYHDFQMSIYEGISGKSYGVTNEATLFDVEDRWRRPFPYYTESTQVAGAYLSAVGFLIGTLGLPPGSRILEFGPGWGVTTVALAQLGMAVTAVDIEANFCTVIRNRAKQNDVSIEVIQDDFFFVERTSEQFDAVLFFECFHHCSDHLRLLRGMQRVLKPGGKVFVAAEPIIKDYPIPWGVRMDGESLWAIRNFGWLELGFDEAYFQRALAHTGWIGEKRECPLPGWAGVWTLQRGQSAPEPTPQPGPELKPAASDGPAVTPDPDPIPNPDPVPVPEIDAIAPAAPLPVSGSDEIDRLRLELASMYCSTSWRLTAPVRLLGAALRKRRRPRPARP